MAKFRRGTEAFESSQNKSGGKFTPDLRWKAGETKYIQFLTPAEEIPTVDFYPFMRVDENEEQGYTVWRNFISPRDAGLLEDNPEARDYLRERGVQSKRRQIALAVEVEPIYEKDEKTRKRILAGAEIKERTYTDKEGTEVSVPNVAFIIQSHIFFGWLFTFAQHKDIENHIFAVTRKGGDQNTRYDIMEVGDAVELDIPEEHMLNLDAFLEELADEERMREWVEDKPEGWVFDINAEKGKKNKSQSRSTVVKDDDEPEDKGAMFGDLRERTRSRSKDASAA